MEAERKIINGVQWELDLTRDSNDSLQKENLFLKLDNHLVKARCLQRLEDDDEPNFKYDVIKDQKLRLVQIAADYMRQKMDAKYICGLEEELEHQKEEKERVEVKNQALHKKLQQISRENIRLQKEAHDPRESLLRNLSEVSLENDELLSSMKKQFKPSRGFVPNLGNFTIGDSSLEVSVDNPAFFSPSEVISKDGLVMDSNQNLDR